ncbi:tubulin tyrosine ligase [Angomonas deanei]|uniref:Tubulin-tyrosine ligase family, putative n=1 Tax=Angomonas deanei TaxID=59799 RepID=A0A7G2C9S6_9TRYP|nr:tubulin tyrosine ligase [Angomonas deanei]CAD2216528.1 Tubulin-tyrosine ligase family, putative [Angomonas deanei]|eukprot:EPY34971.1 tubulin tyrosine ligase [Angomonas deanei]
MKRYFGNEVFDIAPTSFLIPRQKNELLQDAEQYPGTEENPLIYIIKPSASSCGRGIYLHKGVPPMPRGTKQMVCQRYIGNPLLIFGRKFDLRLYCVVTSFDPLRIFLFDEGLVRFAAEKYPGPDKELDNIHMHLTNYSVNKTAELSRASRGKDFDGEDAVDIKWCISDFKKHLQKEHPLGIAAWNAIEKECDDVVTKAFLSIEHDVIERLRMECKDKTGRCCFELFGLDLMADENLKVRLIEVNIMPSLATGSTLDKAVKSRMLAHLLTMVRVIPCRRDEVLTALEKKSKEFLPWGSVKSPEVVYKFGDHPNISARAIEKPLLSAFNKTSDPHSQLTTEEHLMLVEAEEELRCAGGFRRVFPQASTVKTYLPYFTHGVSRNNYLLASAVCLNGA